MRHRFEAKGSRAGKPVQKIIEYSGSILLSFSKRGETKEAGFYIINGFLGSGKTEFINFTLDQPYFQSSGKTLLLLCEEGEEEYDPYVLKRSKTIVETIEEEADFTPEKMVELEKKYHPERIIIEYNGMWKFRDLRLPWHWKVEQQITTIDASTFPMYFTNMKSMVSDMITW